tara:strand:- start:103 stop:603 length:501 start_codon:yes stop_codon:yes gene_type:complete
MIKNIKIKDILIISGIIFLIFYVVLKSGDSPVYKIAPIKKIETRIEGKETHIKTIEKRIGNENIIIDAITSELRLLKDDLEKFKAERDTVRIVQIQDTIIYRLETENVHLNNVILDQDSIIVAQRFIINDKDTIIAVLEHDGKKFKRQRNLSLILNGVLTGVAILK